MAHDRKTEWGLPHFCFTGPWSALIQSLSCLYFKHADIFIFLPSSDHCTRLIPCLCRFWNNKYALFLTEWAALYTQSSVHSKESTTQQQCENCKFPCLRANLEGGPSGLCQAGNESLLCLETLLISRPSHKIRCLIEIEQTVLFLILLWDKIKWIGWLFLLVHSDPHEPWVVLTVLILSSDNRGVGGVCGSDFWSVTHDAITPAWLCFLVHLFFLFSCQL